MGQNKFTSWVKMLVYPLNPDISSTRDVNFGLIIYMCVVQLNSLDCGVFGLEAYAIPKFGFWKVLYFTT